MTRRLTSRYKGVLFHHHPGMTFAAMLLFFYDEIDLGSNNGFTDFKHILNIPLVTSIIQIDTFLYSPGWRCWGCTVCQVTGRQ